MSRTTKPAPDDDSLPDGVSHISGPLDRVALRLTYRLEELADALSVSRRTIERERSAGRFPPPDLTIGKMPLWKPETIKEWIEEGGSR